MFFPTVLPTALPACVLVFDIWLLAQIDGRNSLTPKIGALISALHDLAPSTQRTFWLRIFAWRTSWLFKDRKTVDGTLSTRTAQSSVGRPSAPSAWMAGPSVAS